jgi:two-component system chemotaxis response regulator CheY
MKKRVVVVDDFKNTRWVVEFTLKNENLEILSAENGKEALKHFDGQNIDLLITDLNMPEMDGIELVKEVRNMEKYQFIPIIMLTTERNPQKKQMAEDIKVTAWIQKPFKQDQFKKIVKKALRI